MQQDKVWLMHFQVVVLENCKKYIFGEKETRKNVPHIFFHVKFLGKGSNIIIGLFTQKARYSVSI